MFCIVVYRNCFGRLAPKMTCKNILERGLGHFIIHTANLKANLMACFEQVARRYDLNGELINLSGS